MSKKKRKSMPSRVLYRTNDEYPYLDIDQWEQVNAPHGVREIHAPHAWGAC